MGWFESLGTFEQILYVMAGFSTFAFIIKGVLLVIGADTDMIDAPDDALATVDAFEVQYISVAGVLSFFSVGSWSAIAIFAVSQSILFAVLGGIIAGLIMMYVIARLIHGLKKLQENGNVQIPKAIGKIGKVYLTIPAHDQGCGKIMLRLSGALREMDAVSLDNEPIKTGESVRVVDLQGKTTLVVQKTSEEMM